MTRLRTIWTEFFGLFIDDGPFAAAILIWLAVAKLLLPHLGLPRTLPPMLMALGLAGILVESAVRRARGRRGR